MRALPCQAFTVHGFPFSRCWLARRKAAWKPKETRYGSGAIWKFAQLVGPAHKGAVTHPGMDGEKFVYADI